jgi:hypothetical protein
MIVRRCVSYSDRPLSAQVDAHGAVDTNDPETQEQRHEGVGSGVSIEA